MKIKRVVCAPARTGFYFDDQQAIKGGAESDGSFYLGQPLTPGFTAIRQPGEAISLLLILEDGQVAFGDCAAVQYSGAGGRDPLFLSSDFIPVIQKEVVPHLAGQSLTSFRETMDFFESYRDAQGQPLHTAIRYGLSQAVLDAVARTTGRLMCEVVADEYKCQVSDRPIPIFTQSGDARYDNADKMILKQVEAMPHALINNSAKIGPEGTVLAAYVEWLRDRVIRFRKDPGYQPVFHIDVYGMMGQVFGLDNLEGMAAYLKKLAALAAPFPLRIEGPVDAGTREGQIEWLARLTERVDREAIGVELVADEWCNTLQDVKDFVDAGAGHMIQIKTPDLGSLHKTAEAVLYCKEHGVKAYQGGTCNETNRSAEVCVHVAMATRADQILAKPGMGVDEGIMIAYNEMQRILALRKAR